METKKVLTTLEEVKAISDPFKYRILTSFYKLKAPATVKQIADAINEVPAKVHYHVKKMEQIGILKLSYTKEINGIIAKYFEPTAESFDIKCTDELAEPNKKLMLAESQRILAGFYETSKNIFLDQLSYSSEVNAKTNGQVTIQDLYLTDEEAEEFEQYVSSFVSKYSQEVRNTNDRQKYHYFSSLFKINKDK